MIMSMITIKITIRQGDVSQIAGYWKPNTDD